MDAVFRALADPIRRDILDDLNERDDQTLFELCVRLISGRGISISRQGVSKHIAVLRESGLVDIRQSGRTAVHHLDRAALAAARDWLTRLAEPRDPTD